MLTRRSLLLLAAAAAAIASVGAPGLLTTPALAQGTSPDAATGFVNQMGQDLVAVVNSTESDSVKRSRLGTIIDRVVDVPAVAKFCLGRFWRTATPAQQQQFTQLFNQVIIISIGGHLGDYKGVSFTVGRTFPTDGGTAVRTVLNRPGNPPARVDWVLSNATGSPKIIDVLAEGTSLRLTQRSDYASFLANNGNSVPALLDALHKQVQGAS